MLVVTGLAMAGAELALPALLGRAVDAVVGDGGSTSWLIWVGLVGLVVAVFVVADALDDLAVGVATARSTGWLRHRLVEHVLALGPRAAGRFAPGDITSRLVGNAGQAGGVAPDMIRAVADILPGLGGVVALAIIDPWLCLTFLAGMPVLVVMLRVFARDASRVNALYLQVQGAIAGRLVDALSGARTIAAAGTQDREAERVLSLLPELHRHGLGNWRTQMRLSAQDALVVPLLQVAVLAVAGVELARGQITPGELLAASQYVLLASMLGAATSSFVQLAQARAAAARVAEVLSEPPVPYGTAQLPPGRGRLEFRGVTVLAAGQPVLDRMDLTVPAGTLVAVVGRSGTGKSLLATLAGRLVDPDQGEVLLDGVPLSRVGRRELRSEVGYAFERPALFGETLAEAIGFGTYEPSGEEVAAAARAARADGFIQHMPEGYGTRLADAPMSGGEIQRIGLARAFAHAGRVVVLDDVAASLDTITEHHISRVLTGALADRTRLIVAHRASTAARADLVVWLDHRGVRAVAPHQELWRDPDYRALFEPEPHSPGAVHPASVNGGGS